MNTWADSVNSVSPLTRQKQILCLTATQALNASVIPIGSIAGSLTAVALAGGDQRFAGAPIFINLIMAAFATLFAGPKIRSWGYRRLLAGAAGVGMVGYALAGFAAARGSLFLFLSAYILTGPALGLLGFSRYAAAEISDPAQKARAMGTVVLGSTVGAIVGPWLTTAGGAFFVSMGWPEVMGPWAMGLGIYFLAGANVLMFLRLPSTSALPARDASGAANGIPSESKNRSVGTGLWSLIRRPRIAAAMVAGIAAQAAMVLIMAITPLHMRQCHYSMPSISWVLSSHFVGMFGLSFFSGFLADKLGRPQTIALGALILMAACLLAPHAEGLPSLMLALFLLGWGWNLCFLGASATMAEGLDAEERGRVQGMNEFLVNASSSVSALGSGLAFAIQGYGGMALIGLAVSALPLGPWLLRKHKG